MKLNKSADDKAWQRKPCYETPYVMKYKPRSSVQAKRKMKSAPKIRYKVRVSVGTKYTRK